MDGLRKLVAIAGALLFLGIATLPATVAQNGASHVGYHEEFSVASANLPSNFRAVAGPDTAWQVAGSTLQAINVAGTRVELFDPDNLLNLVDDRLLGVCINPEETINSLFYSGFSINVADLIDLTLGLGDDIMTIRLNLPIGQIQLLDAVGNLIGQVPLPSLIPHNAETCVNVLLDTELNQLLVVVGHTLDSLGHVVDGVAAQPIPFQGVPVPSGTVGFGQPASNTGRVQFSHLWVQTTPDIATNLRAYAGPGNGQVTVRWSAPVRDGGSLVTDYIIYRGTTADNMVPIDRIAAYDMDMSYTDQPYSGLAPTLQKYIYSVEAVNFIGEGPAPAHPTCAVPFPLGMLPLDNTGLGCGSHGIVDSPVLEQLL